MPVSGTALYRWIWTPDPSAVSEMKRQVAGIILTRRVMCEDGLPRPTAMPHMQCSASCGITQLLGISLCWTSSPLHLSSMPGNSTSMSQRDQLYCCFSRFFGLQICQLVFYTWNCLLHWQRTVRLGDPKTVWTLGPVLALLNYQSLLASGIHF